MSGRVVIGVAPSISAKTFALVLERAGSPVPPEEREACYRVVADLKVDPAFALAIFAHESRYGTTGIVKEHDLKNPGATRTSRTGKGVQESIPGRGFFMAYDTWVDGFQDLAFRLVDPSYVYARRGARTPEEIIPIWAPRTDGNNPDAYIAAVYRHMDEYARLEQEVQVEQKSLPIVWLPSANYTPGNKGVSWIILHTTEGGYDGSVRWLRGPAAGSNNRDSSAHYVVGFPGDKPENGIQIAQLVSEDNTAWTAGNYEVNLRSINIEMVGYAKQNPPVHPAILEATAALVRQVAERHGIPIRKVGIQEIRMGVPGIAGHADVPNPNDPNRGGGMSGHTDPGPHFPWDRFLEMVRGVSAGAPQPDQGSEVIYFPETGKHLGHGFLGFWKKYGGLKVFGYPITEEYQENGVTVQYFERARFEHRPDIGNPEDFHVVLGRIGSELVELREQMAAHRGAGEEVAQEIEEVIRSFREAEERLSRVLHALTGEGTGGDQG